MSNTEATAGWYVGRRGHVAHYGPEGAGVYWRTLCGRRLLHSGYRINVPIGDPQTAAVCARCHDRAPDNGS